MTKQKIGISLIMLTIGAMIVAAQTSPPVTRPKPTPAKPESVVSPPAKSQVATPSAKPIMPPPTKATAKPAAPKAEESGILIGQVIADSPAEKAGLSRGDILIAFDEKTVNRIVELRQMLRDYKAGQAVKLDIRRGKERLSVDLTLEDRIGRPVIGIVEAIVPRPNAAMKMRDMQNRDRMMDKAPTGRGSTDRSTYDPAMLSELENAAGSSD